MIYAGIGTRTISPKTYDMLVELGEALAKRKWLLRSGGADGCDSAFEEGCDKAEGDKQIFLPWKGFNGNASKLCVPSPDAFEMAQRYHPAWGALTQGGQKLHARNCHQVMGDDLQTPAHLVICFTEGAQETGGTAQALRIARDLSIPIVNLGAKETRPLSELLNMIDKVGA